MFIILNNPDLPALHSISRKIQGHTLFEPWNFGICGIRCVLFIPGHAYFCDRFYLKNCMIRRRSKPPAASTILMKKSHKYLAQAGVKSLPHGRIDKRYTGIGATTLEITDESRNSIIVCPTVALAHSKAVWAQERFRNNPKVSVLYVGSRVDNIAPTEPQGIVQALKSGRRIKILAVVDSFVNFFNGELQKYKGYFHLVVDEADSLQRDINFRPVMEDCLNLYCEFPGKSRTMISATWYDSVLKKIKREPLTIIEKEGDVPDKLRAVQIDGYLPYFIGRRIKEQLLKRRNTKILVAANNFDLIQEIMVSGGIDEKDVSILCSDASELKAGYLKGKITDGRLPDKKVIFMTSAYYIGIDILDDVMIYVVSDVKKGSSILSPQQIYQIVGRARERCTARYFFFNQHKGETKIKDLEGLKKEASKQLKKLQRLDTKNQDTLIEQYNSSPAGCFYRLREGKLTFNSLLVDFRLRHYTIKQQLYSKGSDAKAPLSEYFHTTLEQVNTLSDTDTKVKKAKEKIRAYKAGLFRICADSSFLSYEKPFLDSDILLAHSLLSKLFWCGSGRWQRWCNENAERYSRNMLKDLESRLDKYTFNYNMSDEKIKSIRREFDEMDEHWNKSM